ILSSEEQAARSNNALSRLGSVNPAGQLFGQQTVGGALPRVTRLLFHHPANLLERQKREKLEAPFQVAIVGVEPELVELVRTGLGRIEPDVPVLALPELGS